MAYESWDVLVQYTAGVWTDITADVDSVRQPVSSTNGATPETTGEPGGMSLVLNNVGFKYTPGNASSAFALRTGMPIRFAEIIAGTTVNLFTGFVEFPETDDVNLSETQSQTIAVNAVDQLSLWERSQTFISTLGAHIMGQPSVTLSAYWSMKDADGGTNAAQSYVGAIGPLQQVTNYNDAVASNQLLFAARGGPPGDDASYLQMDPTAAVIANNYNGAPRLARRDFNIALTSGTVLAFLLWIYVVNEPATPAAPGQVLVAHANSFGEPTIGLTGSATSGWSVNFSDPTHGSSSAAVSAMRSDGWSFVGIFLDVSASTLTLRADGLSATTSYGGAAFSGTFQEVALDGRAGQAFAHLQIVSGSPSVLNQAFFDAQRAVGLTGLDRQTTGDRIKALARYAGKPDYQLTGVDTGCSIMSPARLAGLTTAEAMYEARDTEQGDLYIDGDGNLVFHDRRSVLNI